MKRRDVGVVDTRDPGRILSTFHDPVDAFNEIQRLGQETRTDELGLDDFRYAVVAMDRGPVLEVQSTDRRATTNGARNGAAREEGRVSRLDPSRVAAA
jgi:hypothetical protein